MLDAIDIVRAYKAVFTEGHSSVDIVLHDIANVCFAFAHSSVYDSNGRLDERRTLMNEARREVWLHIAGKIYAQINPRELNRLAEHARNYTRQLDTTPR